MKDTQVFYSVDPAISAAAAHAQLIDWNIVEKFAIEPKLMVDDEQFKSAVAQASKLISESIENEFYGAFAEVAKAAEQAALSFSGLKDAIASIDFHLAEESFDLLEEALYRQEEPVEEDEIFIVRRFDE